MSWHPQRTIEIVAGTPPGGGLDRSARALQRAILAERLVQVPVEVLNVGGDGGRKAWRHIAGFPGDGHVVGVSSPNMLADYLMGATTVDPTRFVPLAILYAEYIAFVVRADAPIKTGADLVRRFAPGAPTLRVALSTSLGNSNHVALAKVIRHAGGDTGAADIRVFDTALDAVADVAAGRAELGAITAASAVLELDAGVLRAIGISSPVRLAGPYAGVPTWSEQGIDCVIGSWRGISGPPGLGATERAFWQATLAAATRSSAWQRDLERHFWTAMYLDGAELHAFLERERVDMGIVLDELGLLAQRA